MGRRHSSARAYGVLRRGTDVLLVRSSNPQHRPALWWLPGGGIDFGESPEDTVVREFREETGLDVASPVLVDVMSDVRERPNGDEVFTVRIIYTVSLLGGELTHEERGTTDRAAWFGVDALSQLSLADFARRALQVTERK